MFCPAHKIDVLAQDGGAAPVVAALTGRAVGIAIAAANASVSKIAKIRFFIFLLSFFVFFIPFCVLLSYYPCCFANRPRCIPR
jgi:hypothetical protein